MAAPWMIRMGTMHLSVFAKDWNDDQMRPRRRWWLL